jgi:hypothetical protein
MDDGSLESGVWSLEPGEFEVLVACLACERMPSKLPWSVHEIDIDFGSTNQSNSHT